MSLHKITAGSGYDYLTRQVAVQDTTEKGHLGLASYNTERDETPGPWCAGAFSQPWPPTSGPGSAPRWAGSSSAPITAANPWTPARSALGAGSAVLLVLLAECSPVACHRSRDSRPVC